MKKILFSALLLASFVTLASSAEASCTKRVLVGYDRCGHPVYREVYVQEHYQPRSNYRSYGYDRSCDDRRSHYSSRYDSRPRFSVRIGF